MRVYWKINSQNRQKHLFTKDIYNFNIIPTFKSLSILKLKYDKIL